MFIRTLLEMLDLLLEPRIIFIKSFAIGDRYVHCCGFGRKLSQSRPAKMLTKIDILQYAFCTVNTIIGPQKRFPIRGKTGVAIVVSLPAGLCVVHWLTNFTDQHTVESILPLSSEIPTAGS
jgi:hypothetical protein